jgi:predicted DNA-binding antitoxin AbrB/MazE fold protein
MSIQVKAIYEKGVFRPLEAVSLREKQEVTVTIDGDAEAAHQVLFALPPDRWQSFCEALDREPREIPALRKLLTEASLFDDQPRSAPKPGPA